MSTLIEKQSRRLFMYLARQKTMRAMAQKYGMRLGADRFVAGSTMEEALTVIQQLNELGRKVTVDHLGEFVYNEKEAVGRKEESLQALRLMHEAHADANLSVKLTSLGLDISAELCYRQLLEIVQRASSYGTFVRIDMEDYAHYAETLRLYRRLRRSYDAVGLVMQAYLYRAKQDLIALGGQAGNVRLVKGAYKESAEVAYPDKRDVDDNFKKLIRLQLERGHFAAVATHDEQIIAYTRQLVDELGIPRDQFEFQMLYGIRTDLQEQLVSRGYAVRVYVPYGQDWYGYFMRRLAERPANVAFVVRGILKS